MRRYNFDDMTQEEKSENMFLLDKVEIIASSEELDEIGLDETYIGRVGYIEQFEKDNAITLNLDGEVVKLYKNMVDEYNPYEISDELADAYAAEYGSMM